MSNVCIFAHFDKDNIIDDYVIYYLKALKNHFDKIIFVSDSDLSEIEKSKITKFVDFVQAYHHGEYDWGSYKFGYIIAKENNLLSEADELLFCNDSVYGPISKIDYSKMNADINGFYANQYGLEKEIEDPHLQSWFLLVKKKVIQSKLFDDFMLSITHLEDKLEIIKRYEIGFTKNLSKEFSYQAVFSANKTDAVTNAPILMVENGFPFLKTRILRKYNVDRFIKQNLDEALYKAIIKHSSRFKKPNIFKLVYNTLKLQSKRRRYIIKSL